MTHRLEHTERAPMTPEPAGQTPANQATRPLQPVGGSTAVMEADSGLDEQTGQFGVPAGRLTSLTARAISAWFGERKVLDRVSLVMEPGTVTALIGPSGCGKSTFLRILNRMHEMIRGASLAGQVLLNDADIYDAGQRPTEVRRRIGMVFQKPNPFPARSSYDHV